MKALLAETSKREKIKSVEEIVASRKPTDALIDHMIKQMVANLATAIRQEKGLDMPQAEHQRNLFHHGMPKRAALAPHRDYEMLPEKEQIDYQMAKAALNRVIGNHSVSDIAPEVLGRTFHVSPHLVGEHFGLEMGLVEPIPEKPNRYANYKLLDALQGSRGRSFQHATHVLWRVQESEYREHNPGDRVKTVSPHLFCEDDLIGEDLHLVTVPNECVIPVTNDHHALDKILNDLRESLAKIA